MSYDYFLQSHLHTAEQHIPTEKILSVFEDYIFVKDATYIDLKFDEENQCTIYMDVEAPYNNGLVVNRPCEGRLGECLYEIMQLGNFVFFEPDGVHMIIANAAVKDHLPEDMIETLGEPVIAATLEEFLEYYHNNR